MRANCLSCGHKVEVDDAYSDYEGLIKCFTCGALLEIKTEEGMFKTVNLVSVPAPLSEEEEIDRKEEEIARRLKY
ncbi:MAG: hypothetical protein ABIG68_00225 [Acidobacteriota bacterium]